VNEGKEIGPPNWLPLETKLRESGRPVSLCAAFMWMWRGGESTFTNTSTHGGICSSIQIAGAGGKAPGNLSLQISNASFIA
jgi:hypothetical protein